MMDSETTGTPARTAAASPDYDMLASMDLARTVQPETLAAVQRIARRRTVPAGEVILTEGEESSTFYLIEAGWVTVYRDGDGDGERLLREMEPGETLGEIAVLDGRARSASARAKTDVVLSEIDPDLLRHEPDGGRLLADLRAGLGVTTVQRMRRQTDEYVGALKREIQAGQERQQFGRFFVYTLSMMTIGTLVNDIIARHVLHVDIYTTRFAWQYLALLMVPSVFVMWRMGISPRQLGVTTVGLKRSLAEGVILSALLFVLAFGLAEALKAFDALPGTPVPFEWAGTASYFAHSLFQELVARGFLQSSFQRFLGDEKGVRSVLLASMLFGMFHLHFGFAAVALTIVTGLFFGFLYLRHRNLAGVTLVHFAAGVAAFMTGLI